MSTPSNPFYCARPPFARLFIFGAGGSGREVAWLAEQSWGEAVALEFLVDRPEYLRPPLNGVSVHLLSEIDPGPDRHFVVALGDPNQRSVAVEACVNAGLVATTIVHPRVEASRWVTIGDGSVICAGTIVTANVEIGSHVQINTDCTIAHDVVVGALATLSPGVHVSGNVRIGRRAFIGTGANIINGRAGAPLVIGDGAVVAAGACVTTSVEPGTLVAGVPAMRKR